MDSSSSTVISGIAASPGTAIGKAFLYHGEDLEIQRREISPQEIEKEISRLHQALEKTRKDLEMIRSKIAEEMGEDHAYIFDFHLLVLEDPLLIKETVEGIRKQTLNAEYILFKTLQKIEHIFANLDDTYYQERVSDVRDVGWRILQNLQGKPRLILAELKEEVIIIARDLHPSDTAQMRKDKVKGFATDVGGRTSHTAIIARALEIPAVVGLGEISHKVKTGDTVIIDGSRGKVIIRPDEKTVKHYIATQRQRVTFEEELRQLKDLPAVTLDGYRVRLAANIEFPEELNSVLEHGAEGIGLYRTEFLYLNRDKLPTEEEQYESYRLVVEKVAPCPVIIRTLDLGGDKFLSYLGLAPEINPFLGLRAIRLCLVRVDIFKTQLRAILRASVHGKLKIMYPLISAVEELRRANQILAEVKKELQQENIPFDQNLEVGAMIEVPSAALTADILAPEIDFFSIGTNDLIQYTLAVDRVNPRIAYLYDPLSPAVLRLLKTTVETAHRAGIWVGVCGEMAGDVLFTLILLGMEIDEFSMSAVSVPEIKKVIRSSTMKEAKELVEKVLKLPTAQEIKKIVRRETSRKFKDLIPANQYRGKL